MSVNYASGLSSYEHKGKCGMAEKHDPTEVIREKSLQLADWIKNSRNIVVITGAGLSTSCGIPDFRGPKGVWTLEGKGEAPNVSVTFSTAKPSFTHLALVSLEKTGKLKYLISQNVDGLHVRSGFPRNRLAELHGNMFVEECDHCHTQYIRKDCVPTMALRPTGNSCTQKKKRGLCRGKLHDTILDWEDALPDFELDMSDQQCRNADLCICLGTSLQIIPCGNMPLLTKKNGGNIAIINLQVTKHDKKCHLKINGYIDDVMRIVCDELCIDIPNWTEPLVTLRSEHTTASEVVSNIIVHPELCKRLEFKTSHSKPVDNSGVEQVNGVVMSLIKSDTAANSEDNKVKCEETSGAAQRDVKPENVTPDQTDVKPEKVTTDQTDIKPEKVTTDQTDIKPENVTTDQTDIKPENVTKSGADNSDGGPTIKPDNTSETISENGISLKRPLPVKTGLHGEDNQSTIETKFRKV